MKILDVVERLGAGTGSLENQRFALVGTSTNKQKTTISSWTSNSKATQLPMSFSRRNRRIQQHFPVMDSPRRGLRLSDFPDHHLGWINLDNEIIP